MAREAMTAEQVEQITALVQDAVGFDEARGDRVNVVDAAFQEVAAEAEMVEPAIWEQPWLQELLRWMIAGLVALALILFVVRPLVKALVGGGDAGSGVARSSDGESLPPGGAHADAADGQQRLTGPDVESGSIAQTATGVQDQSEDKVQAAREMVESDPALAANVIKNWLNEDE